MSFTIQHFLTTVSAVTYGDSRPSIPEYPQIAHYIQEALDAVYYGTTSPKEALDEAGAKSAIASGWGLREPSAEPFSINF